MSAPGRPKREWLPLGGTARSANGAVIPVPSRGGDEVPSPCISVCVICPDSGLCTGCLRTLDEIAVWGLLDAPDKRAVLAALPARRAARGAAPHEPSADADAKR